MIVVDSKEASKNASIVDALKNMGINIEVQPLPVGDYFLIGQRKNIIIERKTVWDYVHSIGSRRLIEQIMRLVTAENAEPRILLEGSLAAITKFSNWSPKGTVGNILSVIEDWRIPIYVVPSKKWTPILLERLHAKIGKPKEEKIYPLRVKPKAETIDEQIRCVVEGFPGVSATLAHNILVHFKTIKNLALASIDDLMEVPKIGKKKAEKIWKIIHTKYEMKRRGGTP